MQNSILKIFMIVIIVCSCGGGNVLPPEEKAALEESPQKITEDGWKYYEDGEYTKALNKFSEASKRKSDYWDSYNGLGWTYFAQHVLAYSISNFTKAVNGDSLFLDCYVGLSLASFENNDYLSAIDAAVKAVQIDSLGFVFNGSYEFTHNTKVNAKALRKILALSYYYNGEFQKSYNQLKTYLKPQVSLDINSPHFPRLLLIELEDL